MHAREAVTPREVIIQLPTRRIAEAQCNQEQTKNIFLSYLQQNLIKTIKKTPPNQNTFIYIQNIGKCCFK